MKIFNYDQFSNLSESEEEKSYTFDELSPEAKQNAIDRNRDYSVEGNAQDSIHKVTVLLLLERLSIIINFLNL